MFPHSPIPTRELIGFLSQQGKRPPVLVVAIQSVQHGAAAPMPGKRTTSRRKAHNASRKIVDRDNPALQTPVAAKAIYLVPTFSRLCLDPHPSRTARKLLVEIPGSRWRSPRNGKKAEFSAAT